MFIWRLCKSDICMQCWGWKNRNLHCCWLLATIYEG